MWKGKRHALDVVLDWIGLHLVSEAAAHFQHHPVFSEHITPDGLVARHRPQTDVGRVNDGPRGAATAGIIDKTGHRLAGAVITTNSGTKVSLPKSPVVATPSIAV